MTVEPGQPGHAFFQCHICPDSPRLAFGPQASVDRWITGGDDGTSFVSIDPLADARRAEAIHLTTNIHIERSADLTRRGATLGLQDDEVAYLGDVRCSTCGHLWTLHNSHCCSFCNIPGCRCES